MPSTSQIIPIIKREEQDQWVDATMLHRFLESSTNFRDWIRRRIEEFGFVEGVDFRPNLSESTGGRRAIEYTITLDMAKELAMLERSEKGRQARQYFINAEKELRRLQSALLAGYDEMDALLRQCRRQVHNGREFYAAVQLRALAGKSRNGGTTVMLRQLAQAGEAAKLYEGKSQKWYVSKNGVNRLLGVRPHSLLSVAIVKLLSTQNVPL